jgi:hypothetical protein
MPGTMITNGMNIFGNEPMIGERRAAEMESRPSRAVPHEVGRPVAEGEHEPEPEHDADHRPHRTVETGQRLTRPRVELLVHRRVTLPSVMVSITLSFRPFQPPTLISPNMVSGTSAATITKNCSTSL